ncbi:MAG: MurR/RpiR family transcriptional regulator [Clostridia bacterium]|nr:MurR/RpiR family transcriptional regulator [Clostridia bacterium]
MDIITRIDKNYDAFSKRQRVLADYIRKNYHKAAFMNVEQLSLATDVSEATVVRFSSELGYEKYSNFQHALNDYAKSMLTSVQRMEHAHAQYKDTDILSSVFESDIDKIKKTLNQIDRVAFSGAVDALIGAKKIYVLGLRGSSALARFLSYYLNFLFPSVKLVNGTSVGDIFEQMFRVGEGDVLIAFSLPRYSLRTIRAVQHARKSKATIIGITDGENSPILELCDYPLIAKTDMEAFVDSLVAPLSLINALIVAISMKLPDTATESLQKLESIWSDNEVYDNGSK